MKSLMTTTALAIAIALPVTAKDTVPNTVFKELDESTQPNASLLASDLIGMRVYATGNPPKTEVAAQAMRDWDDIGEVSDVIMSRDGRAEFILLDIGGFLGIGEKTVAVTFDDLTFKANADARDDVFLVVNASQEMMENATPFDFDRVSTWTSERWQDAKAATADAADSLQKSATASVDYIKKEARRAGEAIQRTSANLTAPTIERDGYVRVETNEMTVEMLTGAPVYDANDNRIGEVSELILDDEERVAEAVLDIGTLLGTDEKSFVTTIESLTINRALDGSDLRVYVDATREQLENMPTYSDG